MFAHGRDSSLFLVGASPYKANLNEENTYDWALLAIEVEDITRCVVKAIVALAYLVI